MTAKNDITGDALQSRPASEAFRKGYDAIQWQREADAAITAKNALYVLNLPDAKVESDGVNLTIETVRNAK